MTFCTLIRRSLRFHWRSHLGVVLGAAMGSAALIGALVVGDSVKGSLREQALSRIGNMHLAMSVGDRFFRSALTADLQVSLRDRNSQSVSIEPVLIGFASASTADGSARVNQARLIGVRPGFWDLSPLRTRPPVVPPGRVLLNEPLAQALGVAEGDMVVLRVPKPTALSREFAVSQKSDATVALRVVVQGVASKEAFGEFNLRATGFSPFNAFVSLEELTQSLNQPGLANTLLIGANQPESEPYRYASYLRLAAASAFEEAWKLTDAQANLVVTTKTAELELRTPRVFLDPPIVRAALAVDTSTQPILTYLVNLLQAGTNATPYSMVTAAGAPLAPADLRDNEIVVNQWLAEDLQMKPGDQVSLVYFDPESGARLVEHTNTLRVHSIVPMEMPWADRTLMPDFPGIEKAESTSEWDAGFPLTYKVRDKDDDYWKEYRGTPKAFVTLAAGQKMWGNRFGNLTAIRFPIPANSGTGVPPVRFDSNGRDARATNAAPPLTPALSPSEGERENRSQSPGESKAADISTASEESRDAQRLSPLPFGRGEGQGEGNSIESYRAALEKKILANLKPEELGLRFEPVREQALKAAADSQDFGGLFLGFSFFVIAAALLLMALLFSLGLEQRAPEIGTLLALGFPPKQVRKLLLREAVVLSLIGGVIGALGGLAYAKAMLHGLTTIWRDAVGASALSFHFTAQTLVIGIFASAVVSVVTIWLTLRKFVKRPARELLVGEIRADESKVQSLKSKVVAVTALLVGLALAGWAVVAGDTANAGIFFGAGALILIAGLSFASGWLTNLGSSVAAFPLTPALSPSEGERENRPPPPVHTETGIATTAADETGVERRLFPLLFRRGEGQGEGISGAPLKFSDLAVRGCARRRKRSLATVAMLACGSFLIVSIGVFRLDANRDASKKTSGTGGFALIGETTMPVVHDLNAASGRDFFALNDRDLEGVNIVSFRVREGDEASCLNLNRAQKPRLLGVKPEMLEGRFGFTKGEGWAALRENRGSKMEDGKGGERAATTEPSSTLHLPSSSPEIPAIGDANSIQWAMGKKVGDTLDYVDERGQPFKVRIVGAVANSILQGQLIIDEAEFVKRFPGESGYRMFLLDAPSNAVSQVSATLSRAMQDVGLELTPAPQRLAQFNAVQNTYLGTFQVLGGLGLLLGSVGLGIVVLRNVLERRGELALLVAVGFRKQQLQRLLFLENAALLAAGLALGVVAAAVAVLPALLSPGAELPYATLSLTLAAVLVNGALWTWGATRLAVRGDLLKALRNE